MSFVPRVHVSNLLDEIANRIVVFCSGRRKRAIVLSRTVKLMQFSLSLSGEDENEDRKELNFNYSKAIVVLIDLL